MIAASATYQSPNPIPSENVMARSVKVKYVKGKETLTDSSTENEVPLDSVPRVDVVRRAVDREGHRSEDESPSDAQGRDDGTSKERNERDGGLRQPRRHCQQEGG